MQYYAIAISFGAILGITVTAAIPGGKIDSYNIAIELCEKDLPHNWKCEITGIAKERNK